MALVSCRESCTSRTVDGPRLQRTRRISSSDAVGFCGDCFMGRDHTTKTFVVSTKIFVHARNLFPGTANFSLPGTGVHSSLSGSLIGRKFNRTLMGRAMGRLAKHG